MRDKLLKCAVINDLSGFGRCSLTVAIPILSALGIQTCPLPTAILSNHTGYSNYYFTDFTEHMEEYYNNWDKLGLNFDAIYTGFLGSKRQVDIIINFIRRFKSRDTLLLVDPVMGDDGKLYSTYDDDLCSEMKRLAGLADIITPNLTEACILAGVPYRDQDFGNDDKFVFEIGERLIGLGVNTVIITGVKRHDKIANYVLDRVKNERFYVESEYVGCKYSGTGDVFASLLCGYIMNGMSNREALSKTAEFLTEVTRFSFKNHVPPADGVAFEPMMNKMLPD